VGRAISGKRDRQCIRGGCGG